VTVRRSGDADAVRTGALRNHLQRFPGGDSDEDADAA